jgi:UDP-N-acetyl-D-mannosaminuronate dehydrogenase
MPAYALELLERYGGRMFGKKVVILGLAFRGGVKAAQRSGAWELSEAIERPRGDTACA